MSVVAVEKRKRRPKWTQSLLSRVRHPSSVLVDIVNKARRDGAPVTVRYNRRFMDLGHLTVDFDGESNIVISAQFIVNGTRGGQITELVPFATDCVLEERVTKLEALRRLLLQRSSPSAPTPPLLNAHATVGEYCLYFESLGQRASAFEFYIDPRRSSRLLADYHHQDITDSMKETTSAKSFVDSDEAEHTSDFISNVNDDSDTTLSPAASAERVNGRLQFIKPECLYVARAPNLKIQSLSIENGAAKRRWWQVCRQITQGQEPQQTHVKGSR